MARTARWLDARLGAAGFARKALHKVFPDHWSFYLGELALWSFVIILVTGVYLTFFYEASIEEVVYDGSYAPLRGVEMSKAYDSTLDLSFDVRAGLVMRQMHHWAALVFVGAIALHMARVFFTGAFRKPREINWVVGVLLLILSLAAGFTGYSLPDDLLSGTGLRIMSGFVLSVPVVGTWTHWALFGGEFPGTEIIPRLYIVHVLLIPGIILALIAVHVGLVWYQKHTQFPGPGRTERNVVGIRILPAFAAKGGGLFAVIVGVTAILGGLFQINPIWNFGPYDAANISAGSQPDWYVGFTEGMLRIFPPWELYIGNYTIPPAFWASPLFLALIHLAAAIYPYLEKRMTKDNALHNLLQRPRDAPVRTAIGVMAITFYFWLLLLGANDIFSAFFNVSLNATIWAGRIGLLLLPPLAYYVTYRICIGLQRGDRAVLEHGVETGIIKRLPHGEFIEVHQPLGGVDSHGHAIPLEYQGAAVPKRMNQLGSAGAPVQGSLLRPDPADETAALEEARAIDERVDATRELAGRPKDVTE